MQVGIHDMVGDLPLDNQLLQQLFAHNSPFAPMPVAHIRVGRSHLLNHLRPKGIPHTPSPKAAMMFDHVKKETDSESRFMTVKKHP